MQALMKTQDAPGLSLQEAPEPTCGPGDVLVRVLRTGICGTDLHIYNWDAWARATIRPPLIVGHEFAGEVVAVGDRVASVRPGDLVSGEGHLVCGRCRHCLAGRRHLCAHTVGIGVQRDGAFAEYIAIPATNVWPHPAPLDPDVAAIFDPFGNAVHCALQFAMVGDDVLITGAGPIGVMAAMVVRRVGPRYVVITDVSDYRLALAERAGVTRAVDARTTTLAAVQRDLGMQEGFDVGLEMSGHPQPLRDMIANMAHDGKIGLLGLQAGEVALDWSQVVLKMLTIRGVYGREMFASWYTMSVLIQSGLDISPVITHRYPYREYDAAFRTASAGQCGKIVLDWTAA